MYSKKTRSFLSQFGEIKPEFSQAPFWFWNDELSEDEISRQMEDFRSHGIFGYVIHPRAGLPRSIGWMSERMLHFIRFAIEQAARTGMWVVLYDEGMYPSGSSAGQVVEVDSDFRPHGLFCLDWNDYRAHTRPEDERLVGKLRRKGGEKVAIVDRRIADGYSVIRGLHFVDDDPSRRADRKEVPENMPAVADILNPAAVACFIRLVYQRYYDELAPFFGDTVKAIFTDEPSFLGKRPEPGAVPGNADLIPWVSDYLDYDIAPHLPALWSDDEPDAQVHKSNYHRALKARLEETYYQQISEWCEGHGVALTGHPADPDDIGQMKYFHIPGQDIVLRSIEPGKESALTGSQSTQAKCASSAMIHLGRSRNSNEYCGAYGHDFTFQEMKWLANWLLVRGCNMLYPHAFYYSVRGPRVDERPPDVGPNSRWWENFKPFSDGTNRLCRLNAESKMVCSLAILGNSDYLPWAAARVCYEHQYDFNYLDVNELISASNITNAGIEIGSMRYKGLIVEPSVKVPDNGIMKIVSDARRIFHWSPDEEPLPLLEWLEKTVPRDVRLSPPQPGIRIRHIEQDGVHCYLLFNEGTTEVTAKVDFSGNGKPLLLSAEIGEAEDYLHDSTIQLESYEMKVVLIDKDDS